MTVVTAFAVSWNPLMNSKAKAIASATIKQTMDPGGRLVRASQKCMIYFPDFCIEQRVWIFLGLQRMAWLPSKTLPIIEIFSVR